MNEYSTPILQLRGWRKNLALFLAERGRCVIPGSRPVDDLFFAQARLRDICDPTHFVAHQPTLAELCRGADLLAFWSICCQHLDHRLQLDCRAYIVLLHRSLRLCPATRPRQRVLFYIDAFHPNIALPGHHGTAFHRIF